MDYIGIEADSRFALTGLETGWVERFFLFLPLDGSICLKPNIRLVRVSPINGRLDHLGRTKNSDRFAVPSLTIARDADGGVFTTLFLITAGQKTIDIDTSLRHFHVLLDYDRPSRALEVTIGV